MTARSDDATVTKVDVKTRRDSDGDKKTKVYVTVTYEDSNHVGHTAQFLYVPWREGTYHEDERVSSLGCPRPVSSL